MEGASKGGARARDSGGGEGVSRRELSPKHKERKRQREREEKKCRHLDPCLSVAMFSRGGRRRRRRH